MNWSQTAQYISDILALFLIIRLVSIRVHLPSVYRVFAVFLGFQLVDSFVGLALYAFGKGLHVDYRIVWMTLQPIGWGLSLWLVYALLSELLEDLPGILRFSRVVLNVVFVTAILLALLTAFPEYTAAGGGRFPQRIDRVLVAFFVVHRAVAMAALLALTCISAFFLWFPVQMRRNLTTLSIGLVVYFAARVALLLLRTYMLGEYERVLSTIMTWVLAPCFFYWIFFINARGQATQVRVGHSWRREEQSRLVAQLESMNTALLRAAARR